MSLVKVLRLPKMSNPLNWAKPTRGLMQNQKHLPSKKKKVGRKKIKRSFPETFIGFVLAHRTPLEYRLILEASGDSAPSADLIEAVSYASLDPYFRSAEFRKALLSYRRTGLYTKPIRTSLERELYFIRFRRERIKQLTQL